jgi:hypothetical protein
MESESILMAVTPALIMLELSMPLVTTEFPVIAIAKPTTEIVPAFEIAPEMVAALTTMPVDPRLVSPGLIVPLLIRSPLNDVESTMIALVLTPAGLVYGNGPSYATACPGPISGESSAASIVL